MLKNKTLSRGHLETLECRAMLYGVPQLVSDVSSSPPDEFDFARMGSDVFFPADDGTGDVELWKSDGTPDGTVLVKDIREGTGGSIPSDFVAANGLVFFTAYTDEFGRELWTTDGTEKGTKLLVDQARGTRDSDFSSPASDGDTAFFIRAGRQLWGSNGTEEGTKLVKSFSGGAIDSLVVFNGKAFFTARSSQRDTQRLWTSDGTPDGTIPFSDANSEVFAVAVTEELLFFGSDFGPRSGLWRSDGTEEGTFRLKDYGSNRGFESLTAISDAVFFTRRDRLWKSDGTKEGTIRVTEIEDPVKLRVANNVLYVTDDRGDDGVKSWRTADTSEGTRLIESTAGADLVPMTSIDDATLYWSTRDNSRGLWAATENDTHWIQLRDDIVGPSAGSFEGGLVDVGGKIYFRANKNELWRTDGNRSWRLTAAPPISSSSFARTDKDLYYFVSDVDSVGGVQLWRTDGTDTGTYSITQGTDFQLLENSIVTDGQLFFTVLHTDNGRTLWRSDGSPGGTELITELPVDSSIRFMNLNGTMFFTAPAGEQTELWTSDGSAEGTELVSVLPIDSSSRLMNLNGTLFFLAPVGDQTQLWTSDGSPDGTKLVYVLPGQGEILTRTGDQIFLTINENQLWASDGTALGTRQLAHSYQSTPRAAGEQLFFVGSTEETGAELWVSDGTVAGTRIVKDIVPGGQGCGLASTVEHNGELYFSAVGGLWKSDGTEEGTTRVKSGSFTPTSSGRDVVYLVGSDASTGRELWQSDGTEEGTVLVHDINPGSADSTKYRRAPLATELNGRLYFTADDGFHGKELWQIPLEREPLPGDANYDGVFDSSDLIHVFQANEFEDDVAANSTWEEGDWNGDGEFDSGDLILAFQSGNYVAAARPSGEARGAAVDSLFTIDADTDDGKSKSARSAHRRLWQVASIHTAVSSLWSAR